ncbi:protein of unknown function [Nitratireductor aquimarinus]
MRVNRQPRRQDYLVPQAIAEPDRVKTTDYFPKQRHFEPKRRSISVILQSRMREADFIW